MEGMEVRDSFTKGAIKIFSAELRLTMKLALGVVVNGYASECILIRDGDR
jgi:hypothetical protein